MSNFEKLLTPLMRHPVGESTTHITKQVCENPNTAHISPNNSLYCKYIAHTGLEPHLSVISRSIPYLRTNSTLFGPQCHSCDIVEFNEGRLLLPNRMNFRKNYKRSSTPPTPSHFRKITLCFFSENVKRNLYKG